MYCVCKTRCSLENSLSHVTTGITGQTSFGGEETGFGGWGDYVTFQQSEQWGMWISNLSASHCQG